MPQGEKTFSGLSALCVPLTSRLTSFGLINCFVYCVVCAKYPVLERENSQGSFRDVLTVLFYEIIFLNDASL